MPTIDKDYFKQDPEMKKDKLEDILTDDEEILVNLKPNKKVYILESVFKSLPVVLLWLGVDVFFIIMMITTGAIQETGMIIFMVLFFGLHLLPVWMYVARIVKKVLQYKNIEYVLTNKRIIIRSGIIGIDYKIFYYQDINSVVCKVGILDKLFKVGDLYINSTNQSAIIEDIVSPYFYHTKIQQIIQDIKTDTYYPNALRPEENPGYKTKYKDRNK